MAYVVAALLASFAVTLLAIRLNLGNPEAHRRYVVRRRAAWIRQPALRGLSRAGGIGVAVGLLVSLVARTLDDAVAAPIAARMGLLLLLCALPVFVAGLVEDFHQGLGIGLRFAAALTSAALGGWFLDAWVVRLDSGPFDAAIATIPAVSIVFTCFAVAGLTNAFNLIDGFNGLAGGVATLILIGIAYVAFKVGDIAIMASALTAVGAIAGFMALNFPRGLIFLGDGGAYLVGFWIAELLVLLVARNPQVSAWFPILVCSYPISETLFSIYRRTVVRRAHPGVPDVAHLHHLIYKRLVRWLIGTRLSAHRLQRNAMTAPYLWVVTSVGVAPAIIFWDRTPVLILGSAVFAAAYVYGYVRIAKFRAPHWWIIRKSKP